MKLDLKTLVDKLTPIITVLRRYMVLFFFVIVAGAYGFLIVRINSLSQAEPSDDAVSQGIQAVPHPKVDQSVIDKIQQLQDRNVDAKTLFDQARNNPFSEQ